MPGLFVFLLIFIALLVRGYKKWAYFALAGYLLLLILFYVIVLLVPPV